METSLRGSGQLEYETTPSQPSSSNQITALPEAVQDSSLHSTTQQPPLQSVPTTANEVGVASRVSHGLEEVEKLKTDMASVWGMSREAEPACHPLTTGTPSHSDTGGQSHSQDNMEWNSGLTSQPSDNHHSPPHTDNNHTITPSHTQSPPPDNKPSVANDPVAMETDDPTAQTNVQINSSGAVAMDTEQVVSPWFSLTPRSPCETKPTVATTMALPNGIAEGQLQLVATAAGNQLVQSGGVMQYYITPSGALAAAPAQMGYALVGNTLVPQQYLATAAAQQPYIISQGGVQYVVGGGAGGLIGLGGVAVMPQPAGGGASGLVGAVGEGGAVLQAVGDSGSVVMAPGDTVAVGDGVRSASGDGVRGTRGVADEVKVHSSHRPELAQQEDHNKPQTDIQMTKPISPLATNEPTKRTEADSQEKPNSGEADEKKQEYITAVLPGQDGTSQYISLPADPRVVSGEYSYAVLQQPDGTSQIVLMENSSINSQTLSLECPPAAMMCNTAEADPFIIDITLMVAEQQITAPPPPAEVKRKERARLGLADLLMEQDQCLTKGWWSINDPHIIDKILRSLSLRGYREKGLYKNFNKHKELVCSGMGTESVEEFKNSFQGVIEGLVGKREEERVGGSEGGGEEKVRSVKSSKTDSESHSSDESGSESSDNSSSPANNTPSESHMTTVVAKATEASQLANQITELAVYDPPYPERTLPATLALFIDIAKMKERLHVAQLLQEWDHPIVTEDEVRDSAEPLRCIGQLLLLVEQGVERCYLKPPLRNKKYISPPPLPRSSGRGRVSREIEATPTNQPAHEEPTEELINWQGAVSMVTSASQLAVLASQLSSCVAWEKSPSKVFCQECHSADNENLLLLCDECDKGTHTYCCKPKLTTIPKGDWYCRFCSSNKSRNRVCAVCDRGRGDLLHCSKCPKAFHKRCLTPPLSRMPSSTWLCTTCRRKSARKQAPPTSVPSPSTNHTSRKRKEDLEVCRVMLEEMVGHRDSWPFLEPVDRSKFPEYFRVIKRPMDFHTIGDKLRDGRYLTREAFASDSRLVFSNCLFYNEDQSKIGLAGHSMKNFFEKRWAELNR